MSNSTVCVVLNSLKLNVSFKTEAILLVVVGLVGLFVVVVVVGGGVLVELVDVVLVLSEVVSVVMVEVLE